MLPFSCIDFFILSGILVLYLYSSKFFLKNIVTYSSNLLLVCLIYLLLFFPKPWHVIVLVIYSYLIYFLFSNVLKAKNKLLGTILLLLPMLLVKTHTRSHFLPANYINLDEFISFAGLSYISFRIVSVYIDAVPGGKPVNFLKYASFLTFPPTLLIGPIDRYQRYSSDVDEGYDKLNSKNFIDGWQWLMIGVLYKYVCAEIIDRYWLSEFSAESKAIRDMASIMYGYYPYLFFDFAGYSAMAIGLGKMMGISIPINFDRPFLSRNPQDFWRRFHKTLGDWLKEYFFTPFYLFFTRKKSLKPYPLLRQNISLFVTFLLMGCWNGFQRNFIFSGLLFGLYSVVHNSYLHYCKKKGKDVIFGSMNEKTVNWISIIIMFQLAAFSIYIFSGRCPVI